MKGRIAVVSYKSARYLFFASVLFLALVVRAGKEPMAFAGKAGDLDITFGRNGIVTTDINNRDDRAQAAAIRADGKIVVAGSSGSLGATFDIAVVRYNSNGSPDTTFGANGIVTTDINSGYINGLDSAIQADGKIVVAGSS